MTAGPGFSSEARVATAAPARYLAQLCKHFAHKLPVTLGDDRGRIAPGQRADLVRIRMHGEIPVVRQVWRAGERVA